MLQSPEAKRIKSSAELRLPEFVRQNLATFAAKRPVSRIMREARLSTVCEEARCPNIGECFSNNTATFMIMGDRCTRRCKFCAVTTKKPLALDDKEPLAVARAAFLMGLRYVVITSVDRDDVPDFGADHFVRVIKAVKEQLPRARIELLTPDFHARHELIDLLLASPIDVFGHNIESVRRLYKTLRPQSDFNTSSEVLRYAAERKKTLTIKSGMMVGVGENDDEVFETLDLLYDLGVEIVTIGQYLRPSQKHWPVHRYVAPETFQQYAAYGHRIGFRHVYAGPLVRSS
ncbi:MAG TPA: lipoyl synthase, partial [Myxococcota bacterium]|nr:lipoyl synthase [Myxococcota bacterium]